MAHGPLAAFAGNEAQCRTRDAAVGVVVAASASIAVISVAPLDRSELSDGRAPDLGHRPLQHFHRS